MKITQAEFKKELSNKERTHNILLIGMSCSGKTHWSKKLSETYHYPHIEFDALIGQSEQLAQLIANVSGKDEAERMGKWFGMPWSEGFLEKEKQFLAIEGSFMSQSFDQGSILDLSGSAIYHQELKSLSKTGLVIYLEASEEAKAEMFEHYISDPKPVCWNGVFKPLEGESHEDALKRCYPLLLADRSRLYEKYADITLPFDIHKNLVTSEEFIEEVSKRL